MSPRSPFLSAEPSGPTGPRNPGGPGWPWSPKDAQKKKNFFLNLHQTLYEPLSETNQQDPGNPVSPLFLESLSQCWVPHFVLFVPSAQFLQLVHKYQNLRKMTEYV